MKNRPEDKKHGLSNPTSNEGNTELISNSENTSSAKGEAEIESRPPKTKEEIDKIVSYKANKMKLDNKIARAKKKAISKYYRKPPAKYQFKPGQSGNPKGRPRKIPHTTIRDYVISNLIEEQEIVIGTKKKKISRAELLAMSLVNDAIKNKPCARRLLAKELGIFDIDLVQPVFDKIENRIGRERPDEEIEKMSEMLRHALNQYFLNNNG